MAFKHPFNSAGSLVALPATRTPRSMHAGATTILVFGLSVAVVGGILVGLGSPLLLLPVGLLILVVVMVTLPPGFLVWALVFFAMLAMGPLVYYARIEGARAVVIAWGVTLIVPWVFRAFAPSEAKARAIPGFIWWGLLFGSLLVYTTAASAPSLGDVVNIVRQYAWFLPLILLLMAGALSPASFDRMWRVLMLIAVLQLPAAAQQHFSSAARRAGINALDAVDGLFPGNPDGGGAGTEMALFQLVMLVMALALWRRGKLPAWQLVVLLGAMLASIALAEVKAAVLLMPLAFGAVFLREIGRRPARFIAMLLIALVVAWGVMSFYDYQYATRGVPGQARTALEAVRQQLDPARRSNSGDLGNSRMGRYVDWYERTVLRSNAIESMFGMGGGATSFSRFGLGKVQANSPYLVANTGTSVLLWEVGIVGHILVVLLFVAAAWKSGRLSRLAAIPDNHQALLHGAAVALGLQVLILPYRASLFSSVPYQLVIALLLGYVAFWARTSLVMSCHGGVLQRFGQSGSA
jgi:hypothetical protein